ncbi:hypothetical protein ACFL35_16410 [Candidatus Riflebacteria bacterium]
MPENLWESFKRNIFLIIFLLSIVSIILPVERHFKDEEMDDFLSILFSEKPCGLLFQSGGFLYYYKTVAVLDKYYRSYHRCLKNEFEQKINIHLMNYVQEHLKNPDNETLLLTDYLFDNSTSKEFYPWWKTSRKKGQMYRWGNFVKMLKLPLLAVSDPVEFERIKNKFPKVHEKYVTLKTRFQLLDLNEDDYLNFRRLHFLRIIFEILFGMAFLHLLPILFSSIKEKYQKRGEEKYFKSCIFRSLLLFNFSFLPYLFGYSFYLFSTLPSFYGSLSQGILYPYFLKLIIYPITTFTDTISWSIPFLSFMLNDTISRLGAGFILYVPQSLHNLLSPPMRDMPILNFQEWQGYYFFYGNFVYLLIGILLGFLAASSKKGTK